MDQGINVNSKKSYKITRAPNLRSLISVHVKIDKWIIMGPPL